MRTVNVTRNDVVGVVSLFLARWQPGDEHNLTVPDLVALRWEVEPYLRNLEKLLELRECIELTHAKLRASDPRQPTPPKAEK